MKKLKFKWKGPGSIPVVTMKFKGCLMSFECPVAVMEAYQKLEKKYRKLKKNVNKS